MKRILTSLFGVSLILFACSSPTQVRRSSVGQPCLHTGFGLGAADINTLAAIKGFGFQVSRIDAQRISIQDTLAQIDDHLAVGLTPLVIIRDAEQLEQLPPGYYELRNEPDLEGPPPSEYSLLMHAAAAVAERRGQILYVGVVSNLNDRGLGYLNALRPFPNDVRVSVHRYGDGSFDSPHSGFDNRDSELRWLRAAIGDLRFAVTEFGYPDEDMSPTEATRRIRVEFEFWAGKADFACLYQLNDGPRSNEHFGIRDVHGDWKPQAYVLR